MAGSIILHKHFTAISMRKVQHMLLQYLLFKFCHSFFVFWAGSKSRPQAYPLHQKKLTKPWLYLSV